MISDRQIAKKLDMSYDTLLRWKKEKQALYQHIKDGFELKSFLMGLDENLGMIYRQTQLMRLKEKIDTSESNLCRVKFANLTSDESHYLEEQAFTWLKTVRSYNFNILAYKDEIEELDEKEFFIDISGFLTHGCEDGSEWLISNAMSLEDTNSFFEWYLDTSI